MRNKRRNRSGRDTMLCTIRGTIADQAFWRGRHDEHGDQPRAGPGSRNSAITKKRQDHSSVRKPGARLRRVRTATLDEIGFTETEPMTIPRREGAILLELSTRLPGRHLACGGVRNRSRSEHVVETARFGAPSIHRGWPTCQGVDFTQVNTPGQCAASELYVALRTPLCMNAISYRPSHDRTLEPDLPEVTHRSATPTLVTNSDQNRACHRKTNPTLPPNSFCRPAASAVILTSEKLSMNRPSQASARGQPPQTNDFPHR